MCSNVPDVFRGKPRNRAVFFPPIGGMTSRWHTQLIGFHTELQFPLELIPDAVPFFPPPHPPPRVEKLKSDENPVWSDA